VTPSPAGAKASRDAGELLVRRYGALAPLSPQDAAYLRQFETAEEFERGRELSIEGRATLTPRFLISGWACRFRLLGDGRRQIFGFIIPGDGVGICKRPRTSIDELPQLINVIKGDMSLVGPRPHALFHDTAFWHMNARYPRRFMARPGITGYAQVSGHRGQTETSEKVEARLKRDLEYIDRWSLSRDVMILAATIRVVFGDRNAF
jgi:hypothetical protein